MENSKKFKAAVFLLLFLPLGILAENGVSGKNNSDKSTAGKNYFIREDDNGTVLIQRLSWESVEDILAYEFELEQKTGGSVWKLLEKKRTKENYIDLSLPPAGYRYRVTVINLLEQPEATSNYRYFDVKIAHQPEVTSVSPKTVHFDDIYDEFVTVYGKNFYNDTTFSLVKIGGEAIKGEIIELDKSGTNAKIKFNINKIEPGKYGFTVTDISGLYDDSQKMTFKFQKPIDFYISGGYAFTGFIKNNVFKEYFNTNFAALGGIIRMTFIPIKRTYGTFGFNITGSGMYLKNKQDGYVLKAGFFFSNFNAVYLLPIIRHKLNFDLHLGTGAAFITQTQFVFESIDIKSPQTWFWGMTVNGGTALQIYLVKKLYIEINLEHIIAFRKDFPLYTIQPSLSLGWEF